MKIFNKAITNKFLIKSFFIAILIIGASAMVVFAAWTEPTLYPPNGNASAPINIGTTSQYRQGNIAIGTSSANENYQLYVSGEYTNYTNKNAIFGPTGYATWFYLRGDAATESSAAAIYQGSSSDLRFWTGADTRMTINSSGNVGIGTTDPGYPLTVNGNVQIGSNLYLNSGTTKSIYSSGSEVSIKSLGGSGFISFYGNDGTNREMMRLTGANLGIGTTNPAYKLDVVDTTNDINVGIRATAASKAVYLRLEGTHTTYGGIIYKTLGDSTWSLGNFGDTANSFNIYTAGSNKFTVLSGGNVGIGTTIPSTNLDINGQIKIQGGSPGANKILTSDSVGLATWSPTTAINDGDWTISGNNQYSAVSGNVGIGTIVPNKKLHVDIGNSYGTIAFFEGRASTGDENSIQIGSYVDSDANTVVLGHHYVNGASTDYGFLGLYNSEKTIVWNNQGNVGIGTTDPGAYKLNVNGQILATSYIRSDSYVQSRSATPYLDLYQDGQQEWKIGQLTAGSKTLTLQATGAASPDVMTLLSTGNVGIGTTIPGYKLDVTGDAKISGGGAFGGYVPSTTHKVTTPTLYAEQAQIGDPTGGLKGAGSINASNVCIEGVCKDTWGAIAEDNDWSGAGTGKMYATSITDSVGIGVTNPEAKLQVQSGNIALVGASYSGIYNTNSIYMADNQYYDYTDSRYEASSTGTSNRIELKYNEGIKFINSPSATVNNPVTSNEAMRITNAGYVGIGTTVPQTKLDIYDSSSGPLLSLRGLDSNYRGLKIADTANNEKWLVGNNTSNNFVIRNAGATDFVTILQGGDVGFTQKLFSEAVSPGSLLLVKNRAITPHSDREDLTNYDGYPLVYKFVSTGSCCDDFTTGQYYSGADTGVWYYFSFLAKWDAVMTWELHEDTNENVLWPAADNTKYQRYVIRSKDTDAVSEDLFRLYYASQAAGTTAYITDIQVWKEDKFGTSVAETFPIQSALNQMGIAIPSGNVSIGTTAPAAPAEKLEVYSGNIRTHRPDNSTTMGYLYTETVAGVPFDKWRTYTTNDSASDLRFRSASSDRMTILYTNGYVGIGTTGPTHNLQVNGYNTLGTSVVNTRGNHDFYAPDDQYPRDLGFGVMAGPVTGDVNLYGLTDWKSGYGGHIGVWSDVTATTESGTNAAGVVSILRGTPTSSNAFGFYSDLSNFSGAGGNTKYGIYSTGETYDYFSGNVGIGTTNPTDKLQVDGQLGVGSINMIDAFTGDRNINNVYKLTVATIDPVYEINGKKYATYAASIAGGVKEEYTGKAKLFEIKNQEYEYIIDFDKIEKGSDLWVWRKAVDFSRDNVDILITPYGESADIYYLIEGNKIIIRGDKPVEFSYRLTGKRFDWQNWPTLSKDQNEKASFIIK
ncbi:MAG: hypothetical protein WC697_00180 [Patescibacteria group bacterium]|jgi:hypothetical protein